MKLVRYGSVGEEKPGLIDAEGKLRDLTPHIDDLSGQFLSDETFDRLRGLDVDTLSEVSGNPRLGACVGDIGKFMCIGLNYSDHAAETGAKFRASDFIYESQFGSCRP